MFDDSIGLAMQKTSPSDTLIVVTADHSHEFNIGGYGVRGSPLFGVLHSKDDETMLSQPNNVSFTPLVYGNGPGGLLEIRRTNLTDKITGFHTQNSTIKLFIYSFM
jgi:alkaline phosphatase